MPTGSAIRYTNLSEYLSVITLSGGELAVDGVLLIGEHGDYPHNENGQHMYPRRYIFEQICGVSASSGRSLPIFCDKHLSYNWMDARWMYDRARELGVPFMARPSLPLCWRSPFLEHDLDSTIGVSDCYWLWRDRGLTDFTHLKHCNA